MYAAGRLLAKKLGLTLHTEPLDGFPRTQDFIDGQAIDDNSQDMPLLERQGIPFQSNMCKLNGADPIPEWPDVSRLQGKHIEIEHGFVNSRYFMRDRDLIKSWLGGESLMQPDPDAVLVNVRLKEFMPLGLALHPYYYQKVLERLDFKKLYLMTDDPDNAYLDCFKKYSPELITGSGPEHFFKAIGFNRIIMSNSTFCWWFTFLSDAQEVFMPMLNGNRCGSWCTGQLPDIDLRLDLPGVTHVYNVPNTVPPNMCVSPTDTQIDELMSYGKYAHAYFLEPMP